METPTEGMDSSGRITEDFDAGIDTSGETLGATVACTGTICGYRSMADGSIRVVVEVNENEMQAFHGNFRIHDNVAIAKLK